jgi:hypothetical protein
LLLKDVLDSGDTRRAVEGMALDFRQKHRLPEVHQLGLVVPDVEAAAGELESKGIGPFFIAAGTPITWCERGGLKKFSGKLGIAYTEGFELELLEPGQGSEFYRQSLDPEGRIKVQHLGFLVKDVDEWAGRLEAEGYPVWVRGKIKAGPLAIEFAYMDTLKDAGTIIEFISWRMMGGIKLNPLPGLIHFLGRLQRWSGKRSISIGARR